MNLFVSRMIRAAKLDASLFEELLEDSSTQGQSVWVVAIFAMATGFGMFSRAGASAVNICLVTTFFAWYLWAFSIYFVSAYFLGESASRRDRKSIMRVLAFASAPGVLRLLGVMPPLTLIIYLATTVWILAASIIGIKKALDIPHTGKIAVLCAGTWILAFFVQGLLLVMFFSAFGVS